MDKLLIVGLGGGLGAVARYGISLLPVKSVFPLITLFINLSGAVLIGIIVGISVGSGISSKWELFWKTGVCGGFTTFSTFSLEALNLIESGKPFLSAAYAASSVLLCILGVLIGEYVGSRLGRV